MNAGHLAYVSNEGTVQWQQALPLTDVTMVQHHDRIVAIGRPIPSNPKKFKKENRGKFIYQAIALNLTDGSEAWNTTFVGNGRPSRTKRGGGGGPGIHQPWTQHIAVLRDGSHGVAVVRGGVVLNLTTGDIDAPHLDPLIHGEAYLQQWGSWLFTASHGQLVAMRWGFGADGAFHHQEVWRVHNELSSFGNTASTVTCDGQYVYHQLPIPEHGPHCPGLWTQVHVHDLQTGNPIGELRPALRDSLQHRMPIASGITASGPVAFLTDAGGGQYAKDHRGQINVVALGKTPRVVQRWFTDDTLTTPPVLTEHGLLVRERGRLRLLNADADLSDSEKTNDLATALFSFIGPQPKDIHLKHIDSQPDLAAAAEPLQSRWCHLIGACVGKPPMIGNHSHARCCAQAITAKGYCLFHHITCKGAYHAVYQTTSYRPQPLVPQPCW